MSSERSRACARCLWEGGSAYELSAHARRAALVVGGRCPMMGAASTKGRSPLVHSRGAIRQLRSPTADRRPRVKRSQGWLRSLSLGRRLSTRACYPRAPRRSGCGRSMHHAGRRTGERPLSFGARPCCDVPATATNAKPMAACQASAGGPALAIFGEQAKHASSLSTRAAPPRVVVGAWRCEGLHRLETALLRRAAVVRRASYNLLRQTGGRVSSKRRHACACCL